MCENARSQGKSTPDSRASYGRPLDLRKGTSIDPYLGRVGLTVIPCQNTSLCNMMSASRSVDFRTLFSAMLDQLCSVSVQKQVVHGARFFDQ